MLYKRKNFIFVKNYADEGKSLQSSSRSIPPEYPTFSPDATNRASICCKRFSGGFPGSTRIGYCSIPTKCIGMNIRQPRLPGRTPGQRQCKRHPSVPATTFSRQHSRADFRRMKNKCRIKRPTDMTDLRRSSRRRCSAKRMSNGSSCSMMTRPSKAIRHQQSVKIIHAGRCPEYSILRKIKSGR